jgi:hypothetical protein
MNSVAQSSVWKVWERRVAGDLGGSRTGPLGFGLPDVSGLRDLAPECKAQARLTLRGKDMEQAIRNASHVNKRWWGLFLRENRTARTVVVIPYDYFVELYNNQKDSNG